MNNENNTIYDFPLEDFEQDWPFGAEISSDLFSSNAYQDYSSLDDFLSYNRTDSNREGGWDDNTTTYDCFYIENDQSYYQGLDGKKYTFKNIPYSLLISIVIKHELTHYSQASTSPYFESDLKWSLIPKYLMFTTFPVRQLLEEGQFMKSDKGNIWDGFYFGFCRIVEDPSKVKSFFSKEDCKEILLYILLYAETPRIQSRALVEESFLTKDLNNITDYFGEISYNYKVDEATRKFF